ncbi:MAG: ATP-dependent DNA ligase [Bacteroidia bacterium]
MQQFADLFRNLDSTTSINEKVKILAEYFSEADEYDRLWALALLSGRRPKRTVKTALLRNWAAETAQIPEWLFEESYHAVGDLAETISLVVRQEEIQTGGNLASMMQLLISLGKEDEDRKKELITSAWKGMDASGRLVFNKLITGGFRLGVARKTVEKALSKVTGISETVIAHRLTGNWKVENVSWESLILNPSENENLSKPYPFCLAYPLQDVNDLQGNAEEWIAEWKWDGIRGQLIRRKGEWYLWSRGEELINEQFPEFEGIANWLATDGTVLDGEILVIREGKIQPFQDLQKRLGRKKPVKKYKANFPVGFIAYDILELEGIDIRSSALRERKRHLNAILSACKSPNLFISEELRFDNQQQLAKIRSKSRDQSAEGLMLKNRNSAYQTGRKRGDWWKWKVDPMTVDAVMIYAMPGHGRRANLYTDYTFAVWDGPNLVPVAKAYSGLTDEEIREVDAFVKTNTIDKFGPVRSVKAELVFELAFENILPSSRHKSGVALRFPRILRLRRDKPSAEADTIEYLKNLIQ